MQLRCTFLPHPAPGRRRAERRLEKAYKALSRKAGGSRNRAKAHARVARLHAEAAGTRLAEPVHDRDVNAASTTLAAGRADRLNACGARVRPGAAPAPRREAGTHRSTA